jgi:hypothetical protein
MLAGLTVVTIETDPTSYVYTKFTRYYDAAGRLVGRSSFISEFTPNMSPAKVPNVSGAVEISAGYDHACAVLADRSVVCWGDTATFLNSPPQGVLPVEVDGAPFRVTEAVPPTGRRIHAGFLQTCAVGEDDRAYCWGHNRFNNGPPGILGVGSADDYVPEPAPVTLACP